jgi:hypothetical protein
MSMQIDGDGYVLDTDDGLEVPDFLPVQPEPSIGSSPWP